MAGSNKETFNRILAELEGQDLQTTYRIIDGKELREIIILSEEGELAKRIVIKEDGKVWTQVADQEWLLEHSFKNL